MRLAGLGSCIIRLDWGVLDMPDRQSLLFLFFAANIVYIEHMPRTSCVDLETGEIVEVGAGTGDCAEVGALFINQI